MSQQHYGASPDGADGGTTLDVDVVSVAGQAVVTLAGEVDIVTSGPLRDRLAEVIEHGATTILFDCDRLRFIDSTGLGVMVWAHKRLRELDADGGILLRRCRPTVARVFHVTALDRVISVEPQIAPT